ncbi:MAG: AI-2E family transporter [Thermoanaerobaculia bacterium]
MNRPNPAVLRLLVFFGGLTAAVVLLVVFSDIFQPLLLGLGIAYLLDPAVSWLERRGLSRVLGTSLIALAAVLALAVVVLFLVPAIGDQFRTLVDRLPEYRERLREQVEPWLARLQARYPEQMAELQDKLAQNLKENVPAVAGMLWAWLAGFFGSVMDAVLFLLNLVFVPVFAFYLLVDWPRLKKGMSDLIPKPYRDVTHERLREVDGAIASFLRGQLVIALILAAINATGLMLLDVPFGLAVGIVAGLANMVPYMALVVGLAPALVLCWVEHQSWPLLLGVVGVFAGAQLLEGTVLSPRILSKSVNLHPVWVLLAVIAGGSLFGFVGMLIAVPAAAAIQVFVRHWVALYKQSAVYDPAAAESAGAG